MKDFAKSIRTNNSVPGSWVKTSTMDGPAQEKEFRNYSLIVQEDKDEERGKKWWSWYVYRGNSEIASGESNSESEAKSKAENWLEHSIPMPTGNNKVGNAYTKGQVLGEEGGKKYVFGGEINGTYIVHRQPDGKTWSFSSEQEIKDWMRNSKIGNSKVGNRELSEFEKRSLKEKEESVKQAEKNLKDAKIEIIGHHGETFWEENLTAAKKDLERAKENLERFKRAIGNRKVGNSSKFDALDSIIQEASMYAENAYRRLSSPYSATNIISDLSHCKQACDIAIKRAQEYDKELQSKK